MMQHLMSPQIILLFLRRLKIILLQALAAPAAGDPLPTTVWSSGAALNSCSTVGMLDAEPDKILRIKVLWGNGADVLDENNVNVNVRVPPAPDVW